MSHPVSKNMRPLILLILPALALQACADEGFGSAKRVAATLPHPTPPLTPEPVLPPTGLAMTQTVTPSQFTGSLFHPSRYAGLAADRRASRVGDLVTIRLVERTQASKSASAGSTRDSDTNLTLPDSIPFSLVPEGLLSGGSAQSFSGSGQAAQNNQLFGDITVTVAEVLPLGVLRVAGEKRLTINRGEEQIQLTGLIRIEDLGPDNSVPSTRVADARIRYAGTGQVADQARQGWLSRFFAKVSPL
jgi:flagellar L-ring protein precursor FlgH